MGNWASTIEKRLSQKRTSSLPMQESGHLSFIERASNSFQK
jgi:hypothetical protein